MASFYLKLQDSPLHFQPVNKDVNVFFDEANKQVFAVSKENEELTNVSVTGLSKSFSFTLNIKGHVSSIKFSPDHQTLAVQQTKKSVEFFNINSSEMTYFSQSFKGRNTQILGFWWTDTAEIFFVTNQGVEFYQVFPEKECLKQIKTYNVTVNWFVYLAESSVLLLSSGVQGNIIHPYVFRAGALTRLPKFEVESSQSTRTPQPSVLLERDVTIGNIYGNIYVVVLRNQSRTFQQSGAEVALYQLQKDIPAKKSCVLRLGAVGRFAVNIIDNLIVVHHQASKTSMIFDVGLNSDFDGQSAHYYPVLAPLPIQPHSLKQCNNGEPEKLCELYSPNWVVCQPNIIIDAKLGCLWQLNINLESLVHMIEDKEKLMDFLLLRQNSNDILLKVCSQLICPGRQLNLTIIASAFDKINSVYKDLLDLKANVPGHQIDTLFENRPSSPLGTCHMIIDQGDMYSAVLEPFLQADVTPFESKLAILMEYIRSLNCSVIPISSDIETALVKLLISEDKPYQLYQFIQYHVLDDSKRLVSLLLKFEGKYPMLGQMALDMLKRLDGANEDIVEMLLARKQLIVALKFLQSVNAVDSASPRKFLQAAYDSNNSTAFYTVFNFFQQRNYRLRKSLRFVKGEQCEVFERHFEHMFGKDRLDNEIDTIVEIVEGLDY